MQSSLHKEFPSVPVDEIEMQLDLRNSLEKAVFEELLNLGQF